MNRLEKYKKIRAMRKKCIFVCMLSFFIMFSGILVADCSINELMNREKGLAIVSIKSYKDDYYYVKVFNRYIVVNTKYIKKDINRLKNWLSEKL